MDGQGLADVLADGLEVVFIGINPASASAAIGHSFASPGNRFWPAMYASGFTATLMRPEQEQDLLAQCLGITSIVRRPTANAGDLTRQELVDGGRDLVKRLADIHPRWAAFLGVTGYRAAFGAPQADTGPQGATIAGARVWVLPNPSGRNAHFRQPCLQPSSPGSGSQLGCRTVAKPSTMAHWPSRTRDPTWRHRSDPRAPTLLRFRRPAAR